MRSLPPHFATTADPLHLAGLGPPTDERLEWIGKKVTSEETELRVRQHELARMTQGGGLSQLAAQLTSSEYGSAETLGSKLEQLEPGD